MRSAIVLAVVVCALAFALYCAETPGESRSPSASAPVSAPGAPSRPAADGAAPGAAATRGSPPRDGLAVDVRARRAAADPGREAEDESAPPCRLAELLEELRGRAGQPGFHAAAWPLVGRIARCLDAGAVEEPGLLMRVLADSRERDVVRGALLVATARSALRDRVRPTAEEWIAGGGPELERAAWIAWALAGDGQRPAGVAAPEEGRGGLVVALEDFEAPPELKTFPARPHSVDLSRARAARDRLQRPLPPEYFESDWGPVQPDVQDEVFARSVAVLAGLGPAVHEHRWVREVLLDCVAQREPRTRAVWKAAAHVLALGARDDETLVRVLQNVARDVGAVEVEVLVLRSLALYGGRSEEVVDALLDLLRSTDGGPRGMASAAFGVDALMALGRDGSPTVRSKARDFAFDRFLDPTTPASQRFFYVLQIATVSAEWTVDAIDALLAVEEDPVLLGRVVPLLSGLSSEHHSRARELLESHFERSDSDSTREHIVRTLAQLEDPGAADFLSRVAAGDDETLSALAVELLAPPGSGEDDSP